MVWRTSFIAASVALSTVFAWPAVEAELFAISSGGAVLGTESIESFNFRPALPDPNQVFASVNEAREQQGLAPLQRNAYLAAIAEQRARDMEANNYYAHKSPVNGTYFYDIMKQRGYASEYSCENLDLSESPVVSTYISDWLNSKAGHRECLLNAKTTQAGYAVAQLPRTNGQDVPSYIIVAIHGTDTYLR